MRAGTRRSAWCERVTRIHVAPAISLQLARVQAAVDFADAAQGELAVDDIEEIGAFRNDSGCLLYTSDAADD